MSYHGVFRQFRHKEPEDYDSPRCPVCGGECHTLYIVYGDAVGCNECADVMDADQYFSDREWEENL